MVYFYYLRVIIDLFLMCFTEYGYQCIIIIYFFYLLEKNIDFICSERPYYDVSV